MTIADEARDSALHCEMVKYALRQNKDGVVVSFVVHPNDIPAALSTSHIGSRWMCALVEIGDDERPIPPAAKEKSKPDSVSVKPLPEPDNPAGAKPDKVRKTWVELNPSTAAAMRCNEPTFRAFLNECRGYQTLNHDDAAEAVREICKVQSRAELNEENSNAKLMWQLLDSAYQAWRIAECH